MTPEIFAQELEKKIQKVFPEATVSFTSWDLSENHIRFLTTLPHRKDSQIKTYYAEKVYSSEEISMSSFPLVDFLALRIARDFVSYILEES